MPRRRHHAAAVGRRDDSKLEQVARQRAPYLELLGELVRGTLEELVVPAQGTIVEIGTGRGALRPWLPTAWLPRMLHTEPEAMALRQLQRREPQWACAEAGAECLPLGSGEAAGIVGVCVADVVPDLATVADEAQRVLAPGAVFVHVLDHLVARAWALARLVREAVVPLPNVAFDPSSRDWPTDLTVIPRDRFAAFVEILSQAGHPTGKLLQAYASRLTNGNLAAARRVFDVWEQDAKARDELARGLNAAEHWFVSQGRSCHELLQLQSCSSAEILCLELDRVFGEREFVVELAEVRALGGTRTRVAGEEGLGYRSLFVGHERRLERAPEVTLTEGLPSPSAAEITVEVGVLVFVARREASRPNGAHTVG